MRSNLVHSFLLMSACLMASNHVCSGEDVHKLTRLGSQMSQEDKVALEQQVAKNPNDVESRTKLLGYYFIKGRLDLDAKSAKQRHILWFIENAPEAEVLSLPYSQLNSILEPVSYQLAKQAWLKVIQESPEKPAVLKNASSFFLLHDRKISEALLLKGQMLEAKNPYWPSSLGQLYALGSKSLPPGAQEKAAAEKAFQQYQLAYNLSDPMARDHILSDLAKTAFAAGRMEEAKTFAQKMLEDNEAGWNQGNRVHHGNLILGRVALAGGNVDEAKSRLLLAGKTSGSPQLDSFGPNMQLAKELLERGEFAVVLEYFELCRKFWVSPRRELDQWVTDVKAKKIPNFGANLFY